MASTTNRWKLGLFVLLSAIAALSFLVWLGASRLQRDSLEAYYYFDEEVSGLEVGAPVKYRGVTIGKVNLIRIAEDRRHVEVVGEVFLDSLERIGLPRNERPTGPEEGLFVPDDMRAQQITSLLTGVTYIQTDFFDPEKYPVPDYPFEVPWNTVHAVPSTAKSIEKGLLELVDKLPELAEESTLMVRRVRLTLEELPVDSLSTELVDALAQFSDRLENLHELPVLLEAEGLVRDARTSLREGQLASLIKSYGAVAKELEEAFGETDLPGTARAIREMSGTLDETSVEFGLLTADLRRQLDDVLQTLDAIGKLADLLERDPGALLRGHSDSGLDR